jgi:hypothetical protein
MMMSYKPGSVVYVNDGSCGAGAIKEVRIEDPFRNTDRSYRCVSLADSKPIATRPSTPAPATVSPKPVAAVPVASGDVSPQLERFIQRVGREKVLNTEPAVMVSGACGVMAYPCGSVLFVNDGSCGSGAIKEITIENPYRNTYRSSRCISLADSKPIATRPSTPAPATVSPKPVAAVPVASGDVSPQLERFIQRVGRDKVVKEEPPLNYLSSAQATGLRRGEVIYVNDGSCGPGRIREVTGIAEQGNFGTAMRTISRPSRCIPLE